MTTTLANVTRKQISTKAESIKLWLTSAMTQTENPAVRQHIGRALLMVYANQTADEQREQSVKHNNGKGFSGGNAVFGSSIAEQFSRRGDLTPKQAACIAKMLRKHAKQIATASMLAVKG
jgi:hypothetical protein